MDSKSQTDGPLRPVDSVLIDPEAYDASEQEFAASLDGCSPRFVVKPETAQVFSGIDGASTAPAIELPKTKDFSGRETAAEEHGSGGEPCFHPHGSRRKDEARAPAAALPPPAFATAKSSDSWRNEVAARLDQYRARRRPREPRYPSLQLKFDSIEPAWSRPSPDSLPLPQPAPQRVRIVEDNTLPAAQSQPNIESGSAAESSARVIPFRRSAFVPPLPLDELAEPVLLAPRILEAPEIAPPQPALGGILIEAAAEDSHDKRPGIEVPVQPAAMSRRLLATAVDMLVVFLALALFGYIFFRTSGIIPPPRQITAMVLLTLGVLWPAYQYALLVYVGATPGLRLAKLRLSRFNGQVASKSLRRWRVLASALSGVSLGLGYAWSILDEDQLCWHDRITETYMAPMD